MEKSAGIVVVLVFASVVAIGFLGSGLTGNVSGTLPLANSVTVSVLAAVLGIGVLIVAGLQQKKN